MMMPMGRRRLSWKTVTRPATMPATGGSLHGVPRGAGSGQPDSIPGRRTAGACASLSAPVNYDMDQLWKELYVEDFDVVALVVIVVVFFIPMYSR